VVIPKFDAQTGDLPPGIHSAEWGEFSKRFGGTPHRRRLLVGLRRALEPLRPAGCITAYVDGSFVTDKVVPNDYDVCWDPQGVRIADLDPVLRTFDPGRIVQKMKYLGELFPMSAPAGPNGITFLELFQTNRHSGLRKGIVALDLRRLP
jgi:hypothetical protein